MQSRPGRGTTFKVYLPRIAEVPGAAEQAARPHALRRGSETVLLAEDETFVRDLAARTLREAGYEVLEAANGLEALRRVDQHREREIQLLITDVVMPRMSGRELAAAMRSLSPDIKVLFISGYATEAITQHGRLEPGTNFLSKPFTRIAFAHKVREILNS